MSSPLVLPTKHTIVELLNTGTLKTVSDARWATWEAVLLPRYKSISIIRNTGLNPAEGLIAEGEPHKCQTKIDE